MDLVDKGVQSKLKSYFVYGVKPEDNDATSHVLEIERVGCSYPDNITLIPTRLINKYATHHSKIMVLFTKDRRGAEFAEVVIHTANLIPFDWINMTQGVWRSGKLPKSNSSHKPRFLEDFTSYLQRYGKPSVNELAAKLKSYDFTGVKATLIASVPGNYKLGDRDYDRWGINRMQAEMAKLSKSEQARKNSSDDAVVCQMSSIATLGKTDNYLSPVLLNGFLGREFYSDSSNTAKLKIVFPTLKNIQESLNGYDSGVAIHYRDDADQTAYLRQYLCKWSGERSGRDRAAPHIKTYMRINSKTGDLSWFLLTSANLSKQAWGTIHKTARNQYIQSWECGVLLHGKMFGESARLVPAYRSDTASNDNDPNLIPIRMPFDLPLSEYSPLDEPWYPLRSHPEADWLGSTWEVS
jgi:tyrosyl-DNA phosphodiesterase-1